MIKLLHYQIPALIDTGATVSCISSKLLNALTKTYKFKPCHTHQKVFTADGSTQTIRQVIKLPLKIHELDISHRFLVFPNLTRTMILGVDFLKRVQATIYFTNLNTNTLTIRLPETVSLPPLKELTVLAEVRSPFKIKGIGVTENMYRKDPVPYLVKRAVVKPTGHKNKIPLTVFNSSALPCKLYKDSIMGLYEVRSIKDFVSAKDVIKDHDSTKFDINPKLSDDQKKEINEVLNNYLTVFVGQDKILGLSTQYEHRIDLKRNYTPLNIRPYRMSPQRREYMENMLVEQHKQGIIEPCEGHTEWASPAFLVEKPRDATGNRQYRMVVDFRHLNSQIKDQARTFPRADDTLHAIGQLGGRYFSKLDAHSGFFQIPLRKKDRPLTAFTTPGKKWHYRVMPMGLKTSPKAFHNVIAATLSSVESCLPYVDDIIVATPTWDDHVKQLTNVFRAFQRANIKFKLSKCSFGYKSIPFLGFIVSAEGIQPSPDKTQIISNYPCPTTLKELRAFNGLANYYKSFIPNYSNIMRPLYDLTKTKQTKSKTKILKWNDQAQKAFTTIKKSITNDVTLLYPCYHKPFTISADASDYAIGACISQNDKNNFLRPVAFAGRKLKDAERNYSTTDRELLALKFALEKFEHFIIGRKFTIFTDHAALLALNSKINLKGRMARWLDTFTKYDYEILHVKGKLNVVPDTISRMPTFKTQVHRNDNIQSKHVSFNPIHFVKLYFQTDLLENYPITVFKPKPILKKMESIQAITRSMTTIKPHTLKHDKQPPHNPKQTKRGTKAPRLLLHQSTAKIKPFRQSRKTATIRRHKLKKVSAKFILQQNYTDVLQHVKSTLPGTDLIKAQDQDTFCKAFKTFITCNDLPQDNRLAREILLSADHFFVYNSILFRNTHSLRNISAVTQPQVVVPQCWVQYILTQLHDSPLGAHVGASKLVSIIKPRFYWNSMIRDAYKFVSTCHICLTSKSQKKPIKLPLTLRDPSPAPFAHMSIDSIGPLHKTCSSNKYIQVVVDYYSRYVFAWATKTITAEASAKEFFNNVICRVGVPTHLYSDNGPAFSGDNFKKACKQFGIQQIFGSCYKPTTQGLVERTNQTLVQAIRGFVDKYHNNWDEFIPAITFALNISTTYSLGYSPFLLVHGRHATVPAQAALSAIDPSLLTVQEQLVRIINNQDKICQEAKNIMKSKHANMKLRHDRNAKEHSFERGQIVYVKNPSIIVKGTSKKLQPIFSGPFLIIELPSRFTAKLRRLADGKTLPKNVHVQRLKLVSQFKENPFIHRTQLDTNA